MKNSLSEFALPWYPPQNQHRATQMLKLHRRRLLGGFNGSLVLKLHKSVGFNDASRTMRMEFYTITTLNHE